MKFSQSKFDEYEKAGELFQHALALQPDQRASWLASQTGENRALYDTVIAMLDNDDQLGNEFDDDPLATLLRPSSKLTSDSTVKPSTTVFADGNAESEPSTETSELPLSSASVPLPFERSSDSLDDTTEFQPKKFGNYRLIEEIGRGSMGVVYKAQQTTPQRIVAVKTIQSGVLARELDVLRFINESHATAKLNHENVVPVYEVGTEDGVHFYSMQWIDGTDLGQVLKEQSQDTRELLQIFLRVCKAVAHCHDNDIIHRDLKPSNILLDNELNPKVSDFGLARNLATDLTLTNAGDVMGTPGYMAPELAHGAPADSRGKRVTTQKTVDVYSLGAILYHILTGRPPILASDVNLLGAIQLIKDHDVVAARVFNRRIHRDLDTICSKCLETDPTKRYVDANELAADLIAFLNGEPVEARRLTPLRQLVKWAKHHPGLAVSWLAIGVLLGWHLINHFVLDWYTGSRYFFWTTAALAIIWAFAAWAFQRALLLWGGRSLIHFAWATVDVLMLSALLMFPEMEGATSHLIFAFFPIVAAAALRMRMDLVTYVTVLSIVVYLFHVARNNLTESLPDVGPSYYVAFPLCLATLGLIEYFSLRRSQFAVESFQRRR